MFDLESMIGNEKFLLVVFIVGLSDARWPLSAYHKFRIYHIRLLSSRHDIAMKN